MSGSIDEILDECLAQLESGQATVQECLASHPDHAESLCPLMQTALEVRGLEQPTATEEGFEEGKELMLSALAFKKRERAKAAVSPSPWPMRVAVGVLPQPRC